MDNKFEPLAIGEVLSIDDSALILIGHRTFRVGEFAEAMRTQLEYNLNGWTQEKDAWFSPEGISCEVLRFTAGGWQKGRVRINLEFCPQDSEDEEKKPPSPKVESKVAPPAPVASEDKLNLEDSPFDSASLAEDLAPTALLDTEPDLGLEESPFDSASLAEDLAPAALLDTEPDLGLEESPFDSASLAEDLAPAALLDTEPDLGLEGSLLDTEDELNMEDFPMSLGDEFSLETPAASDFELEQEAPNAFIIEREREVIIMPAGNEMATSLEDNIDVDLGELSQSIDQELELVDAPMPSDDELLDLAEMSLDGNDDLDFGGMTVNSEDDFPFEEMSAVSDDDLDFGEMSAMDDDFDFPEMSLSDESEENDNDALLDDVWQDINQPSWQNHQH